MGICGDSYPFWVAHGTRDLEAPKVNEKALIDAGGVNGPGSGELLSDSMLAASRCQEAKFLPGMPNICH